MDKIDELLEVLENKENKIAELEVEIIRYSNQFERDEKVVYDKTININIY